MKSMTWEPAPRAWKRSSFQHIALVIVVALLAACPRESQVPPFPDSGMVVQILSDGTNCLIREQTMPCERTANYLKSEPGLKPVHQLAVMSVNGTTSADQRADEVAKMLKAAGFENVGRMKVGFITEPSSRAGDH
jgi:hypothetical protein